MLRIPTGIVWVGHVSDLGGYGNVSRNYLRVLKKCHLPICIVDIGETHQEIGKEELALLQEVNRPHTELGTNPILIINSIPEKFNLFRNLPFRKRIGVTLFETDRLPPQWVPHCNQMDEIWVPSHFNYQTFSSSGVNPKKIKVIPYPIDIETYNKEFTPFTFSEDIKSFIFLYTLGFDYRKGLDLLIKSYCEEFTDNDDVSLVLKIYQWNRFYDVKKEIQSYIPNKSNNPHIHIYLETFSREQLLSLYASSTCYVSTDRACGWGLPQMEMMSMGKPVISIDWGGGTEFMNGKNAFLIKVETELEPVHPILQETRRDLYFGHKWPKVKEENVRTVLREVYTNKLKRDAIAIQGKLDIKNNFSIDKVLEKVITRLLF